MFPIFTRICAGVSWLAKATERAAMVDLTRLWMRGIKVTLSLLILTILAALTGGVLKTFLDLKLLLHHPVEVALRQVIIDTLIILAVVELFKTTLTYFSEGRVKVTFIVDTILGVMRIMTVRFSPVLGDTDREPA